MMATSPHKGQRLAAPTPTPTPTPNPNPTPTPSTPAPTPALHIAPDARLPAADWHVLFDAVKGRLLAAADNPTSAAVVVPECVAALDYLQGMLDPPSSRGR